MRITILLIISILLSSCSSQFAYRHLDWIALWYCDDYLDLSRQQERNLETELSQLLGWHKQSELPKYRLQLLAIADDLSTLPLADALITQHIDSFNQHWQNMRQRISEQVSPLAVQLNVQQVNHLFAQLEERNQDRLEDYLDLSVDERNEKKLEQIEALLIDWLGSIDAAQATLLYSFIHKQYDLTLPRIAYLRAYQAELKRAMQSPIDIAKLQGLLNNPDPFKSTEYIHQQNSNRKNTTVFIRQLSAHIQPEQFTYLQKKLKDYIQTIDELLETDKKKAAK
ncbi:MAG: hypothetical protein ACI8SR_000156 [Oceanicoccus sp.]|jgi:hypothetical protein